MNEKQFISLLPFITANLTDNIKKAYFLSEDKAILSLYGSQTYEYLEDEKTKLWNYSVPKIFDIYRSETENGIIDIPDN